MTGKVRKMSGLKTIAFIRFGYCKIWLSSGLNFLRKDLPPLLVVLDWAIFGVGNGLVSTSCLSRFLVEVTTDPFAIFESVSTKSMLHFWCSTKATRW